MSKVTEKIGCFVSIPCCTDCDWFSQPPLGMMSGVPRSVCPKCGGAIKHLTGRYEYREIKGFLRATTRECFGFVRKDAGDSVMSDYINRRGKFMATRELAWSESFADALAMMRFIPLRVEYTPWDGKVEFIGVSKLFDELMEGEIVPLYAIDMTADSDGVLLNVKASRLDG